MSVKFTTIESKDKHQLELLFEFLDYELPEYIDFEYATKLGKTVFINNLQTNQIKGIYLQPIKLEAEFVGTYYSSKEKSADKKIITAKQRADQLGRLQGQLLKFFFDGFKQIVIIENFKMRVHNQEHVEVDMTLQPHDIIEPKTFTRVEIREQMTVPLEKAPLNAEINSLLGGNFIPSTFNTQLNNLNVHPQIILEAKEKQEFLLQKAKQIRKDGKQNEEDFIKKKSNLDKIKDHAIDFYSKKSVSIDDPNSTRALSTINKMQREILKLEKEHFHFKDR